MSKGKYTVNEVEERSKIAASTLRQWERRYDFPRPERSPSGYRLYSDDDLHAIEAMKKYIAEGVPASRAAELVKQLKPTPPGPRSLSDMSSELIDALVNLDEAQADCILSEAHALHPVEAVMLELLQKSMIDIGQQWHDGLIGVSTEHFASQYVQGRLRSLLNLAASNQSAPAVIIACAPLEQHELGPLILAVMLRRAAYQVYFLGANTPLEDLSITARSVKPTAVMISASTKQAVEALLEQREHLVDMAPILAFGGAAFDAQPELAASLGGVYLAQETRAALERFQQLEKQMALSA